MVTDIGGGGAFSSTEMGRLFREATAAGQSKAASEGKDGTPPRECKGGTTVLGSTGLLTQACAEPATSQSSMSLWRALRVPEP